MLFGGGKLSATVFHIMLAVDPLQWPLIQISVVTIWFYFWVDLFCCVECVEPMSLDPQS